MQSSIAVTYYIQTATNLPTPKGWKVWLALSAPGVEPRSSCMDTHERAHTGTEKDLSEINYDRGIVNSIFECISTAGVTTSGSEYVNSVTKVVYLLFLFNEVVKHCCVQL